METERSSNLRFFVVVVNFEKKSCSVIYSNSLLIARGLGVDGKQQVEVQVPNYRLVDGGTVADGHRPPPDQCASQQILTRLPPIISNMSAGIGVISSQRLTL